MSVNVNNNGTLKKIAGGTLYADAPIGSILAFGGSGFPTGWHLCDGTAVSRTTYKDLFNVIGTNFGVGDGSTTFNLPELRGEFLRGAGTNSHTDQGNGGAVGEHQDATEMPWIVGGGSSLAVRYTNTGTKDPASDYKNMDSTQGTGKWKGSQSFTVDSTNDSTPITYSTRPTNTSVNYIIKMFKTGAPADFDGQDIYSTAERRVGTWIDGSPVYEKTFSGTLAGSASSWTNFIDLTSLSYGHIIDIQGMLENNSGSCNIYTVDVQFALYADGNMLKYKAQNTDWDDCAYRIVIRYTKTTD